MTQVVTNSWFNSMSRGGGGWAEPSVFIHLEGEFVYAPEIHY